MKQAEDQTILVTGGLGYIGSHTTIELIRQGFEVVIIDNLSNSEIFILDRIEAITSVRPIFYQADVCDAVRMQHIFFLHKPAVIIHFAACKSVSESVKAPLKYFKNNLGSLLSLLECMSNNGLKNLIFSSSATVYGYPEKLPANEETPFQNALNAYGDTKQMGEKILDKMAAAGSIRNISLRYFNPVGAHHSGLIGELPKGIPDNLFPYLMQTAVGKLESLTVFGNDYNTPDGSCLRDYIHVVDLACAHVSACLRLLENTSSLCCEAYNIGTGTATSVLEAIRQFEMVTGQKIPYRIGPRREGDAPAVYADPHKANAILGWEAKYDLYAMIQTGWRWQCSLNA